MENKKAEVAIILPNYNSEKFIEETIKSVLNQNYKNWKLFVIDDSSNFESKKKLEKYKRFKKIKIFWLKKNKGTAHCRNLGIKKSNSNYIAFLDSDDIWHKNKLDNQIKFMKKNNYHFTYTYYKTIGLKNKNINTPLKFSFKDFIKDTSIATSSMVVKREILKGIKFENTKICEDYFFKCQILKKIGSAHCLKKYLTKYRIRKNSLQSNRFKNFYWIWRINYRFNKLNFMDNLFSILSISLNSLKKYGLK